jgi:hypothetical protein
MKIVRDYYAVYHTDESSGDDICIKDNIGRYTIVNLADLDQLVEDLVRVILAPPETESVLTEFKNL